ncbi:hypothetical protein BSKO_10886 [Bryopsis sp. KO-2023]|nr:hypothetical protein BSKO_10886 [Bryopsis sp. KO-2023]
MARRGVWHLDKMCLFYCEYSGSSRGAREFLTHSFTQLKESSPWLTLDTQIRRGNHPFFLVRYRNGNTRLVDLKNKNLKEIDEHMYFLRNSVGRRTSNPTVRHTSKRPSIQGMWTPMTFVPEDIPIAAFDKLSMDVRLDPPEEPEVIAPSYKTHRTNSNSERKKRSRKEKALAPLSGEAGESLVSRWTGTTSNSAGGSL